MNALLNTFGKVAYRKLWFISSSNKDKRGIDDPGLNQDDSYEKDNEDFDNTNDFDKYDNTIDKKEEEAKKLENKIKKDITNSGRFDGTVTI